MTILKPVVVYTMIKTTAPNAIVRSAKTAGLLTAVLNVKNHSVVVVETWKAALNVVKLSVRPVGPVRLVALAPMSSALAVSEMTSGASPVHHVLSAALVQTDKPAKTLYE